MQLNVSRKLHYHLRVHMTKYDTALKKLTKLERVGMMTKTQAVSEI